MGKEAESMTVRIERLANRQPSSLFKFPKERGVVVVFSIACIMALLLCRTNPIAMVMSEIVLWSLTLSIHRPRQFLIFSIAGAVMLCFIGSISLSLWMAVIFAGKHFLGSHACKEEMWLKETLGIAGAISAPLMVSYILTEDLASNLVVACVLVAGSITGVVIIRVSHKEMRVNPMPASLISLCLWVFLAGSCPVLVALALVPYLVQGVWLIKTPKPSFKQLGQAQAASLFFLSILLVFHIFSTL